MHLCMRAYVHTCVLARMSACMFSFMHTREECVHASSKGSEQAAKNTGRGWAAWCIGVCLYVRGLNICTSACACRLRVALGGREIDMFVQQSAHVCAHDHRRVCIHVSTPVYTHVYAYTYTHIHAHVHTHACTHVLGHVYTHVPTGTQQGSVKWTFDAKQGP